MRPRKGFKFEKPYEPLLCPEGIAMLDQLARGADVLEVGAGESTLFFAERAKSVYSLEHSVEWAQILQPELLEFDNVRLVVVNREELGNRVKYARNESFDLVYIDCYQYQRREAIERAVSKVRPGGSIVVDDAYFPSLSDIDTLFEGWDKRVIRGKKVHVISGKIVDSYIKIFERPV